MKKVILVVAMVFATGGLINANSGTSDEIIKVDSSVEVLEERSCIRGCVDYAIKGSLDEGWAMMRFSRMQAYHQLVNDCYKANC